MELIRQTTDGIWVSDLEREKHQTEKIFLTILREVKWIVEARDTGVREQQIDMICVWQ